MNKLPNGQKTPPSKQTPIDFSGLHADFHLTSQERRIVSEAYKANEEALLRATRGNLRSFITKDYGAANFEALGGTEGIKTLQKALGVKEDGYFGPATFQALIAFQESNGLKTDAIAGPETRAKLGISEIGNTRADTQPTSDELPNKTEWQHAPLSTLTPPSTPIQTEKTGIQPAPQPVEQEKDTPLITSETKTETADSADTNRWKTAFHGMSMQDIRPDEGFLVWSAKHAMGRSAGVVGGIGAVISGLGDLTAFVYEYGENLIWDNPERKKQMDEQMKEIWNSVKGTEFQGMPDRVMEVIGKEILRVYLLPSDEQDHAIGNFAGKTISTLGVLKAWSVAGWYLVKGGEKMVQATRIQSKLAKQGLDKSARAARVKTLEMQVKMTKYTARSLDIIVNGFAESALSYGLQKSIRSIVVLLRSSKSTAEKIQAVDAGIRRTDEALKKSEIPEQQAEIAEVREVLETAKTQLVQEAKISQNPVENGENSQTILKRPKNEKLKAVSVRRESIDAGTSAGPKLWTVKSGLDTKHPVEQKDRGPQAPGQKTSLRLVGNPLKNTKPQDIPERISRHDSSVKETSTTQKPTGESRVSQESATRAKPPKIFKTEWVPPKKLYRSMTMYYHPDRNFHPRAEPIFKCIQEKYNAYEKWGRTPELLKKFQTIARDPEGHIKKEGPTIQPEKGPEKRYAASREQFMKDVQRYAEKNSEAELRQLAQLSPKAFGSALLYRDVYTKILALAAQDIGRAERAFAAFRANPESYFAARLTSVDLEIQKYTQNAYEGAFKRELEMLKKNRPSLHRAYMQEQRARETRRAA